MAKRRRCKDKLPHAAHDWRNNSTNLVVRTVTQGRLSSEFWCPGSETTKEAKGGEASSLQGQAPTP